MKIMETVLKEYDLWCQNTKDDEYMANELLKLEHSPDEMLECFGGHLEFGTSGIRGLLGPGPRRINKYVIARVTQGFADYMKSALNNREDDCLGKIVIAYDSRHFSKEFADETAKVLSGNGFKAYVFPKMTPVPVLSYSIGELDCDYGVMITASHNAGIYNGYKVFSRHGYQIVGEEPHEIVRAIEKHEFFQGIIRSEDNIEILDESLADKFLKKVEEITLPLVAEGSKMDIRIIYTPLNGTGDMYVKQALKNAGFENVIPVASQEVIDPDFTTCKKPNPEKISAYSEAFRVLDKEDGDIIIATDPDSDRVGVALIHEGTKINLTGNQIGLLILDHLCKTKHIKPGQTCYRSIVSSPLIDRMAEAFGLNIATTLTGFKYIGEAIETLIDEDRGDEFFFGFEESNGFLVDPFIRDKDAISSAVVIAAVAAYQKSRGQDLMDHLQEIYSNYGTLIDKSKNYTFNGLEGEETMTRIMEYFRNEVTDQIDNLYVEDKIDYLMDDTGLPPSNIIKFDLDDGSTAIIRPSGTEPKIKVYMFLTDPTSLIDKGITEIMENYK